MKKLNTNPPSPVEHNESAVSDSPAAGSQVPADDVVGSLDTSETAPVQQPAQPEPVAQQPERNSLGVPAFLRRPTRK